MPIRPALGFIHARKPRPSVVRPVRCPYCGHGFETSLRTMTIRCPRCTEHLAIEDKTVTRQTDSDLATVGYIRVMAASVLTGRIVCGHLVNAGRFNGTAIVHGPIELDPRSITTGQITARSIRTAPGAVLRAKMTIGPTRGEGLQRPPSLIATGT